MSWHERKRRLFSRCQARSRRIYRARNRARNRRQIPGERILSRQIPSGQCERTRSRTGEGRCGGVLRWCERVRVRIWHIVRASLNMRGQRACREPGEMISWQHIGRDVRDRTPRAITRRADRWRREKLLRLTVNERTASGTRKARVHRRPIQRHRANGHVPRLVSQSSRCAARDGPRHGRGWLIS